MKRTKEGFYKQGFVAFIWAIFSLMLYSCGETPKSSPRHRILSRTSRLIRTGLFPKALRYGFALP